MKKTEHVDPLDTLGATYENMYESVAHSLHEAKDKTLPLLHEWIDEARNKAVELDELTEEDAKKLAEWLKRDFNDITHYLAETESELEDWLGFEVTLIKSSIIQNLLETADKTTLALLRMKANAHLPSSYHTGEMTGPGTLICDECQKNLHFHKPGRIPRFPKVNATRFLRIQID